MRINLFEAGRRLLRVCQALLIFGGVVALLAAREAGPALAAVAALYLVAVTAFAMIAGWVIRGLLGIQSGSDWRDGAVVEKQVYSSSHKDSA